MSYVLQLLSLLLALFGAFYKHTTETDNDNKTVYWYGLPKLTRQGKLLVSLLAIFTAGSLYSSWKTAKKAKAENDDLRATLSRVQVASTETRQSLASRLYPVSEFTLSVFFADPQSRNEPTTVENDDSLLRTVFCSGPPNEYLSLTFPVSDDPPLDFVVIATPEIIRSGKCPMTKLVGDKFEMEMDIIPRSKFSEASARTLNAAMYFTTVRRRDLEQLRLSPLNMDSFILSNSNGYLKVFFNVPKTESQAAAEQAMIKFLSEKLPTTIGFFISPMFSPKETPNVAWYFGFRGEPYITGANEPLWSGVLWYDYKRDRHEVAVDELQFFGLTLHPRFEGLPHRGKPIPQHRH